MVTSAKIGYGTTLSWNSVALAELTRIGAVRLTASKQDSTSHDSANSFKEFVPGLIDPGDVEIEGFFRPDDSGQVALETDMIARTSRTAVISFPTALSTTTWTFTAYVVAFEAGDATPEGLIPFRATLGVVGKPTLGVTASTGMSALTAADSVGAATIFPTFAIGTFTYDVPTAGAATWIKWTPTAASHVITITSSLGESEVVASGAQSGAFTITSGAITTFTIKVQETGKSAKTYTLYVTNAA